MGSFQRAYTGSCLLLLSLLILALRAAPITSDENCPYEPLPDSLDTYGALGFNGELHLHNQYYTKYNRGQSKTITFTIKEQSTFRLYVEPHYVDIDLWLYDANNNALAVCIPPTLFIAAIYCFFLFFALLVVCQTLFP